MLMKTECDVAVITARTSNIVAERMASLGIKHIYQGVENKDQALKKLIDKLGITFSEVAYVGDDVIDLPAMNKVALPIAVADAHSEVKKIAKFITENNGGQGAVREICELIMIAQNNFEKQCGGGIFTNSPDRFGGLTKLWVIRDLVNAGNLSQNNVIGSLPGI